MRAFWMVFLCFALLAGFVLVVQHRTHWFGAYGDYVWPLLLALCPLLHLILHGRHGHGGGHE